MRACGLEGLAHAACFCGIASRYFGIPTPDTTPRGLCIRYFPPRTTERTRGVGTAAYYHPMGKRAAQDPIAENLLGPYWTPSSARRPAKSPNLADSAELLGGPKPAKRARAPTRLPPAPPERVRRDKPPPPPVTIIQHIYLGADPACSIPPARSRPRATRVSLALAPPPPSGATALLPRCC